MVWFFVSVTIVLYSFLTKYIFSNVMQPCPAENIINNENSVEI